jgi:hypothetical protein
MANNRMVPPVTLKGARVPIERLAGFSPHRVIGDGAVSSTPAAREASRVLASRSRAVVKTARPFEHPIIPTR